MTEPESLTWIKALLCLILARIEPGPFWDAFWGVLAFVYGVLSLCELWIARQERKVR